MPYWASTAAVVRLAVVPVPHLLVVLVNFVPREKASSSAPFASRVSVFQRVGSLRRKLVRAVRVVVSVTLPARGRCRCRWP